MKKRFITKAIMIVVVLGLMLPAAAMASDLTDFVRKMNAEAKADLSGFKASLHAQFPVPGGTIDLVLSNASDPADAYMMLRIGEITGRPVACASCRTSACPSRSPEAAVTLDSRNRWACW